MNNNIKICFTGYSSSSFILNDFEILKKHFIVDFNESPERKSGIISWLKFIFRTIKKVKKSNITFCWFASWYSAIVVFFSKIFRKKSIVVIGGYDVAYAPEIKYGAFTNLKEKIPAKYVLRKADLLLPVSEFTKNEILKKVKPKNFKVVNNGIITESKHVEKEKIIITIGQVTNKNIKLKGLDTFAKVASHFPDYKFVIIGKKENSIENELKKINKNIIFTGLIPHKDVLKWLNRSVVYCQLSYIESFGLGVAEAMSCGCIPVVTDRGGLLEVVGDIGFIVPYGDENSTVSAIKKALKVPDNFSKNAREEIVKKFSLKIREKKLVKIILKT